MIRVGMAAQPVEAALKAGYLERVDQEGRGARTLSPTDMGYDLFAGDMHLVTAVPEQGLGRAGDRGEPIQGEPGDVLRGLQPGCRAVRLSA